MSLSIGNHFVKITPTELISSKDEIKQGSGIFSWIKLSGPKCGKHIESITEIEMVHSYGDDPSERVSMKIKDPEIEEHMTCIGDDLLSKMKILYSDTSKCELEPILARTNSLQTASPFEKYYTVFLDDLASSNVMYMLMGYDSYSIGNPFYTLNPILPSGLDLSSDIYTKNSYDYTSYMVEMMLGINKNKIIGNVIMEYHKNMWTNWGCCFVDGDCYDPTKSIYASNLALARHFSMSMKAISSIEKLNERFCEIIECIEQLTCKSVKKIKQCVCEIKAQTNEVNDQSYRLSKKMNEEASENIENISTVSDNEICRIKGATKDCKVELTQLIDCYKSELTECRTSGLDTMCSKIDEFISLVNRTNQTHEEELESYVMRIKDFSNIVSDEMERKAERAKEDINNLCNASKANIQKTGNQNIGNVSDITEQAKVDMNREISAEVRHIEVEMEDVMNKLEWVRKESEKFLDKASYIVSKQEIEHNTDRLKINENKDKIDALERQIKERSGYPTNWKKNCTNNDLMDIICALEERISKLEN